MPIAYISLPVRVNQTSRISGAQLLLTAFCGEFPLCEPCIDMAFTTHRLAHPVAGTNHRNCGSILWCLDRDAKLMPS